MKVAEIIVANTDSVFDALFRKSALIATFLSASDSKRYGARDDRLRELLEAVVQGIYDEQFTADHLCVGYDCWPDHTRHIEVDDESFSQKLFDALHTLLIDQYAEWRIQVAVYESMGDGNPMIGSITIWADKLLVDRKLYEWMLSRKLHFGTIAEPRFVADDPKVINQSKYTLLDNLECWPW